MIGKAIKNLVSVVIPIYNSQQYIEQTLLSVFNQTYQNYEVIIVDDGSTDKSLELINSLSIEKNNIKIINQKNSGPAAARNKGVQKATGEWIAFLDADDLWLPNKLELQINNIENNPTIDLIYCGCISFSENIETKHPIWMKGFTSGKEMLISLFSSCGITNSSVMVKREIITKAGLFNEAEIQRGTEDYSMWLNLANLNCNFYSMENYLVKYRLHPMGIHYNRPKMLKGTIAALHAFKNNPLIPYTSKVKRYRDCYRELFNATINSNASKNEIKTLIDELEKIDSYGIITKIQSILIKTMPSKWALVFSQILYRLRLSPMLPF